MNEPITQVKKPNGCWWLSGCLLTVVSALLIAFFVYMIFYSEEKMDESRAEYSASQKEYEDAQKAYEADSANLHAQYLRIQAEIEAAKARHDSVQVAVLQDSLSYYDKPEFIPRGHIGVNIGAAFLVVFILFLLVPLGIGLLLLIIYQYKIRKWKRITQEDDLNLNHSDLGSKTSIQR